MKPDSRPPKEEPGFLCIETGHFGAIRLTPEQIITLAPGLLGFPDLHHYILLQHSPDSPFLWLQSLDRSDLAFVVMDPGYIVPDYQPGPQKTLLRELEAESPEDLQVLVVVTIPRGCPQEMTANLLGPVVINLKTRRGKQLVLDRPQYSHKHRVLAD